MAETKFKFADGRTKLDKADYRPVAVQIKKDLGKLIESDYYPIQVAYFDLDPNESLPEYQIKFHMQKNGVVSYYEVDYGDFVISAKLKEIRAIENRC